jgi:hypothetical protein
MTENPCPYPNIHKKGDAPLSGICRHCKEDRKYGSKKRELCSSCLGKYPTLHWMKSCEVPACPAIFDGTITCAPREGKIICGNCTNGRRVRHSDKTWEEFCEIRATGFARPTTFADTDLEEKNIKWTGELTDRRKAECQCCKKEKPIYNYTYQLCMACMTKEQYKGEICSCCNYVADGTLGMVFRKKDSAPTCINCMQRLSTFNMTIEQYQQYVVALDNQPCPLCDKKMTLRINGKGGARGSKEKAINMDHDHKTGMLRGAICGLCNRYEGMINTYDCIDTWYESYKEYMKTPFAILTPDVEV